MFCLFLLVAYNEYGGNSYFFAMSIVSGILSFLMLAHFITRKLVLNSHGVHQFNDLSFFGCKKINEKKLKWENLDKVEVSEGMYPVLKMYWSGTEYEIEELNMLSFNGKNKAYSLVKNKVPKQKIVYN